jgi:hypothetical protein
MNFKNKNCDDMSFHELDSHPFGGPSRVHTSSSGWVDSAKSSFDLNYLQHHQCEVSIRDEASTAAGIHNDDNSDTGIALNRYTILGNPNLSLPQGLKSQLEHRISSKTRWINVVGWSEALMDDLARRYLNDHGCLDLHSLSKQMLGGPIKRKASGEFIWIQTTIWFLGGRNPNWSSVQQSGFRMVLCMPTRSNAGTLITNFVGRAALAEEISRICTENVLANHAMGSQALGCVWILAFSILRSIAEQVDFAFQTLDPTAVSQATIPRMDDLPFLLEKANHLARLDRYISGLDEFSAFFVSVRSFQHNRDPSLCSTTSDSETTQPYRSRNIRERATLESSLAQQKIVRAQRLCSTFLRQYESLVQMVSLHGTALLTFITDI